MDDTDRNGANYPRKRSAIAVSCARACREIVANVQSAISVAQNEANVMQKDLHAPRASILRWIACTKSPIFGIGMR